MVNPQTTILPFVSSEQQPNGSPDAIASSSSLLEIDREIDLMLDQMQDELEEQGEVSEESRSRFQQFCEAFGQKVDRIGRFLRVMENREAYCRSEAARLAARARSAENKITQTKLLVLYFLESRNLLKMEGLQFTLRRQKNSVDSVRIQNPDAVPIHLCKVEAKFSGELWAQIGAALPTHLKHSFLASLVCSTPISEAIRQELAAGAEFEGVTVSRGHHIRVA